MNNKQILEELNVMKELTQLMMNHIDKLTKNYSVEDVSERAKKKAAKKAAEKAAFEQQLQKIIQRRRRHLGLE